MSTPLSIRLPEDLDTIIRERASAEPGLTITEVIVTALRRGLEQSDPVHEAIGEIKQQMQGLMDRLDAQERPKPQSIVPAPKKPSAPVTYRLEPSGWLRRFLLGELELKPDRSRSTDQS